MLLGSTQVRYVYGSDCARVPLWSVCLLSLWESDCDSLCLLAWTGWKNQAVCLEPSDRKCMCVYVCVYWGCTTAREVCAYILTHSKKTKNKTTKKPTKMNTTNEWFHASAADPPPPAVPGWSQWKVDERQTRWRLAGRRLTVASSSRRCSCWGSWTHTACGSSVHILHRRGIIVKIHSSTEVLIPKLIKEPSPTHGLWETPPVPPALPGWDQGPPREAS